MHSRAVSQLLLRIICHMPDDVSAIWRVPAGSGCWRTDACLQFGEKIRVCIGPAADHDAVYMLQMPPHIRYATDAAIQHDGKLRKITLEPIYGFIFQRRDTAIFLWTQTREDGFARMNNEQIAAGRRNSLYK